MRRKKHKHTRRSVAFYKVHHGFREPYKVSRDKTHAFVEMSIGSGTDQAMVAAAGVAGRQLHPCYPGCQVRAVPAALCTADAPAVAANKQLWYMVQLMPQYASTLLYCAAAAHDWLHGCNVLTCPVSPWLQHHTASRCHHQPAGWNLQAVHHTLHQPRAQEHGGGHSRRSSSSAPPAATQVRTRPLQAASRMPPRAGRCCSRYQQHKVFAIACRQDAFIGACTVRVCNPGQQMGMVHQPQQQQQ